MTQSIPEEPDLSALPNDAARNAAWKDYNAQMRAYAVARGDSMSMREFDGLTSREKGWLCALVMKRIRHDAPFNAGIRAPGEWEARCLLVNGAHINAMMGLPNP